MKKHLIVLYGAFVLLLSQKNGWFVFSEPWRRQTYHKAHFNSIICAWKHMYN